MRFATIKLIGLISLQVVSALPAITNTVPSRIAKRAPGIDEEVYLKEEIDVGDQIGKGTDGTVYKAHMKEDAKDRPDWNKKTIYALKKDYPNNKMVQTEFSAYEAINGQGIGPKFAALVDDNMDDINQIGIMLEYIESKAADKSSKSQAKGAMDALKKMHDLGWMHGDLHSLSNVLVRKSDSKAFLIDFAKSKQTTDSREKKEDIDALKAAFSGVEWDGDEPKN